MYTVVDLINFCLCECSAALNLHVLKHTLHGVFVECYFSKLKFTNEIIKIFSNKITEIVVR